MTNTPGYPFTAIVEQPLLKLALLVTAVDPTVGGLLIQGDKGSAKSTAARALSELLPTIMHTPGCEFNCEPAAPVDACPICTTSGAQLTQSTAPFVNLPLGATEDRLLGTLDFQAALSHGKRHFQPGLLAKAHRGVLYIDEVNLLPDHLVDVLLDVAAMGHNHVEREGISVDHPSKFILLGSMNPEEGELRPQLFDRFAMVVTVQAPKDSLVRAEVVRRRLRFEQDARAFANEFTTLQAELSHAIQHAKSRLSQVRLDDDMLEVISDICSRAGVTSLRSDIVLSKVARVLAALEQCEAVTHDHVRAAAALVLPHRMSDRRQTDNSEVLDGLLQDLLNQASEVQQSQDDPSLSKEDEQTFEPNRHVKAATINFDVRSQRTGNRSGVPGRQQGRFVRAMPSTTPGTIDVQSTVKHSLLRNDGAFSVDIDDLHTKEFTNRSGSLFVFIVDSSGSMAAMRTMEAVKGATVALLQDAYRKRDHIALITCRGETAEIAVHPTRSSTGSQQLLGGLPTGGRTPLASALSLTLKHLKIWQAQHDLDPVLVLFSDGKANVGLTQSSDPWNDCLEMAKKLSQAGVPTLLVDTQAGLVQFSRTRDLADALGAAYITLNEFSSQRLVTLSRGMLHR